LARPLGGPQTGLQSIRFSRLRSLLKTGGSLASGPSERARDRGIVIVQIDMILCGAWEVKLSTKRTGIICGTLADAKDEARRSIGRRPYEVIIRDAYHRVLEHERLGVSCK